MNRFIPLHFALRISVNIKSRFCRDGSIVFKLADGCPGGAVKLRIGLTNALEKAYNCLPNVKKLQINHFGASLTRLFVR